MITQQALVAQHSISNTQRPFLSELGDCRIYNFPDRRILKYVKAGLSLGETKHTCEMQ